MEDSHYSVVAVAEPSVEAEFVFGDEYCRYLNDDDGNGGGDEDDGVHVAGSADDDETNGTENSNVVVVVAVVAVVAWSGEVDVENFDDDGERYDDTAEVVVAAAAEMNYGYSHD